MLLFSSPHQPMKTRKILFREDEDDDKKRYRGREEEDDDASFLSVIFSLSLSLSRSQSRARSRERERERESALSSLFFFAANWKKVKTRVSPILQNVSSYL
jgi:hypothetical protein